MLTERTCGASGLACPQAGQNTTLGLARQVGKGIEQSGAARPLSEATADLATSRTWQTPRPTAANDAAASESTRASPHP